MLAAAPQSDQVHHHPVFVPGGRLPIATETEVEVEAATRTPRPWQGPAHGLQKPEGHSERGS